MPEYRSLEDDHLRDFFLRNEVLKRLRANGEITENNDVICTLKDFNQFRRELDRSKRNLELKHNMENALYAYDQRLVEHAEKIAKKTMYDDDITGMAVRERRIQLEKSRQENFERKWQHIMERIQQHQQKLEMERASWKEKRILNELNIKHHNELMVEMARRRIIKNKIQTKVKMLRSRNVLVHEERRRLQERYDRLWESWQKRLSERINSGQYMYDLLEKANEERKQRIIRHSKRYQKMWADFQKQLSKVSRKNLKIKRSMFGQKLMKEKKKKNVKENEISPRYGKFGSFNELLDDELYYLLSGVVDVEEFKIPFDDDDPLYKAAEFIKEHVLRKFRTDLSIDDDLILSLKKRLAPFLVALKFNILQDGKRILSSLNVEQHFEFISGVQLDSMECKKRSSKAVLKVKFKSDVETILGDGYELHPNVTLRDVTTRTPTPKSSLASILVEAENARVWGIHLSLKRTRIIFIEYVFAKFKRQVIVGVQNRVLDAIKLYCKGKRVVVRKELLDISEYYLITKASKAILSFAVDKINFDACVFLCINMISTKIICMLQKFMEDCECYDTGKELVTHTWLMMQQYILPGQHAEFMCS